MGLLTLEVDTEVVHLCSDGARSWVLVPELVIITVGFLVPHDEGSPWILGRVLNLQNVPVQVTPTEEKLSLGHSKADLLMVEK